MITSIDNMEKYLLQRETTGNVYYSPMITKYENEGNENAYIAAYGRTNYQSEPNSGKISYEHVLFKVMGRTFEETIDVFIKEYNNQLALGHICGRYWKD